MKSNIVTRKTQDDLFAEWNELGVLVGRLSLAHPDNVHIAQANNILHSLDSANQLWYGPADDLNATLDKAIQYQAVIDGDVSPINAVWQRSLDILLDVPMYEPASINQIVVVGTCS